MKEHFENFGWLNFLKTIAMDKVFDMAGYNSIDSVRLSPCFDVLVYASEDKLLKESEALDYQAENK